MPESTQHILNCHGSEYFLTKSRSVFLPVVVQDEVLVEKWHITNSTPLVCHKVSRNGLPCASLVCHHFVKHSITVSVNTLSLKVH